MPEEERTLVLVCRRNFCRILDQLLRAEGVNDFTHGNLSFMNASNSASAGGVGMEVFVVPAPARRAEEIIQLLRACPFQGTKENGFEVYLVGED